MTAEYLAHLESVSSAKDHLGMVEPRLRGQLARFLDRGEEPSAEVCRILDGRVTFPAWDPTLPSVLMSVFGWAIFKAPGECWGSKEKRLAWQERVAALVPQPEEVEIVAPVDGVDGIVTFVGEVFLGTANEPHDTERPPAEAEELAAQ